MFNAVNKKNGKADSYNSIMWKLLSPSYGHQVTIQATQKSPARPYVIFFKYKEPERIILKSIFDDTTKTHKTVPTFGTINVFTIIY